MAQKHEALRSWTVPGDPDLTITIHTPTLTLKHGDGPEIELNADQVAALWRSMDEADCLFEGAAPRTFD